VQHFCLHTMYRLEEALMIRELRVLEDPDLSTVIALRDDLETTFFADIADGVADGTFHLADPRSAGRAVLALCRSIAGWYSPEGPATPEEIAVEYVAFALRLVGDRATVTSQH
jgi:hypothetical protein